MDLTNLREGILQPPTDKQEIKSSDELAPIFKDPKYVSSSLEGALNKLFPEQAELSKVSRARQILGECVKNATDDEIESSVTEFEYLLNDWLNEFERDVFEGKTLQEILREV